MDLSKINQQCNFSDKVLLGFTYVHRYLFLSFLFLVCFICFVFFFIISIIIIIIIIIIIKVITFFIAFWGTTIYIVIKIIFIIIVIISLYFFVIFFFVFFSSVCDIQIRYRYCFHYMRFVFYSAFFFFLLQKILGVFCGDLLSQWWAVHLLLFLFFSLINHFLTLSFGILFLLIELILHNH